MDDETADNIIRFIYFIFIPLYAIIYAIIADAFDFSNWYAIPNAIILTMLICSKDPLTSKMRNAWEKRLKTFLYKHF